MLVPSKFTRLEESTIFKMAKILRGRPDYESLLELYHRTRGVFQDASEFLHAVDALYVLGMLEVDELGQVNYA
ncbi:ABC-three component system middle component 7 [Acidovorax sp. M14]|uniref:ABC-three component system middle component 7 n=1 Tax=Acidovorax sp. M14 TaxID=3411354 RepID=UPI003BF4D550